MIKFFKEIFAPAIFIKGVLRYKENDLEESKKWLLDAADRKPDLRKDDFYNAVLLLVEFKLGTEEYSHRFQGALDALENSPYRNIDDYAFVVADLKHVIEKHEIR